MGNNRRLCTVKGSKGLVVKSYTHTMDVFLFKKRMTTYGVHKKYVRLLPLELPKVDRAQLKLEL